ncbi:MAG TPA: CAP domain-containing protein [Legionellaceae bacterium]|nr:CAP domain-containing protein [Legionellaceae bacterium]
MLRQLCIGIILILGWFYTSNGYALNNDAMAKEIVMYINQFRMSQGLPKLVLNPILSQEAQQHSIDMAQHRVSVGHDGFYKRMSHLHQKIQSAQSGAENVAFNYKTAKIVSAGWIKSRGHRRNILGHYDQTGIGIAYDKQGRPYFTQLFLKTT